MSRLLLALGVVLALSSPVRAQPADAWIDVTDPVLEPTAPYLIARHYLVWDGRENCGIGETARLVVAFHGGAGSAESMADLLPGEGCYVVAYPSGSNKVFGQIRVSGNTLSWNASSGTTQGWAENNGVNDDLFVASLVAALKAAFGLTAVFAVGRSKGGMLAFHLACDTATFAALATVASTISDPSCDIAFHVPNLHIHGTADDRVCWFVWYSSCDPWPKARPKIVGFWQAQDEGHELHVISGGTHGWQPVAGFDTAGTVWMYLNNR